MRTTALLAVGLTVSLVMAGCAGDGDEATTDDTGVGTTVVRGTEELVAEANTVAVAYFQAHVVQDFDAARDVASGAAELVVQWDESLADVEAVQGTRYEIEPQPAPAVRVQITGLREIDDDRYAAEGFLELGERPGGVASTTTTEPPEGEVPPSDTSFVTDLVFTNTGDRLRLDDYRYDDVAYPVSDLYLDPSDDDVAGRRGNDTTTTTADAQTTDRAGVTDAERGALHLAKRDVDGSFQLLVSVAVDGGQVIQADLLPTGETEQDAITLDVYSDADEGAGTRTLLVQPGGFPGRDGTIRADVQVAGAGEPTIVEIEVPALRPLGAPERTNTVRAQEQPVGTTTTTIDAEDEADDDTTTTTGATPNQTPTTLPTTTTTQPTTTTTQPTTTTTAATTTTGG